MKLRLLNKLPLISNRTKILISLSLLLFAMALSLYAPNQLDRSVCLIAMCFSFMGDVALNCTPHEKRPHWLLYTGAFFFMLAHLCYAVAYRLLMSENNAVFITPGAYIAYAIMALIFIASIWCFSISQSKISTIFVFALYLIVISINFITICSYSWSSKALSFIGAISFLISDYIIGIETLFKIKNDILRKLVWIFYPIGQVMIIFCR